jgi:hypothetical protein
MDVNGGASYVHPLWNFDCDEVVIDHWYGSTVYLVEPFQMGPDRKLILLNPVRTIYTWLAWSLPGKRLHRRLVVQNQLAMIRKGDCLHLAKSNSRTAVIIPEAAAITALVKLNTSKTPYLSDCERI